MRVARVLLLASALVLGGWSGGYGESLDVINWNYYAPFCDTKMYTYNHNFSYNGQLNQGEYILGFIYFTKDIDLYNFNIGTDNKSNIFNNEFIYNNAYNESDGIYYLDNELVGPIFKNAYNMVPVADDYVSFGVYWNYSHGGGNLSLFLPIEFAWNITSQKTPQIDYDYYGVFYIQDSNRNIIYSQGLQVGNPSAVPLPGTALLLGSGLAGLALMSRRLRRR